MFAVITIVTVTGHMFQMMSPQMSEQQCKAVVDSIVIGEPVVIETPNGAVLSMPVEAACMADA